MMDHLSVGPAAQTGPELFRLRTLIAFHPDDPVPLYMQPERAAAPAIKGGSGPDDPDFVAVRTGIGCTHTCLPRCRLSTCLVKNKKNPFQFPSQFESKRSFSFQFFPLGTQPHTLLPPIPLRGERAPECSEPTHGIHERVRPRKSLQLAVSPCAAAKQPRTLQKRLRLNQLRSNQMSPLLHSISSNRRTQNSPGSPFLGPKTWNDLFVLSIFPPN